jgi:hypothetical protein
MVGTLEVSNHKVDIVGTEVVCRVKLHK